MAGGQVLIISGSPKATIKKTATGNIAQFFSAAEKSQSGVEGGRKPTGAIITVEDNDLRWAVGGGTPTLNSGTALGHLMHPGDVIKLSNFSAIDTFKWINTVAGAHNTIQVTLTV